MMDRKPRIGVFGLGRGRDLMNKVNLCGGQLVAVCDRITSKLPRAAEFISPDGGYYEDFDEFIKHDMDAVIIANYFNCHAEYAIKAMKAGKAVLSECTPAATMAECVELVRTAEETGMTYMLAENYPYTASSQELRRVYKSGRIGEVMFAEGEYVHPISSNGLAKIAPAVPEGTSQNVDEMANPKYHWRRWLARTYYSTHSMAPLMYATDLIPKSVTAVAACIPEEAEKDIRFAGDGAAPMFVEMSNGAIFRITGSVNYGPSGSWYRLACTEGGVETIRGNRPTIRLSFPPENLPAGVTQAEQIYTPDFPVQAELAKNAGHGGGDFFVVYNFIQALKNGTTPYFDVYRSVALSEMAILGWRSVIAGGVKFEIPDLRIEANRKKWENDRLTPFPVNETGEGATLPCISRNIATHFYDDKPVQKVVPGNEASAFDADGTVKEVK